MSTFYPNEAYIDLRFIEKGIKLTDIKSDENRIEIDKVDSCAFISGEGTKSDFEKIAVCITFKLKEPTQKTFNEKPVNAGEVIVDLSEDAAKKVIFNLIKGICLTLSAHDKAKILSALNGKS